MSGSLRELVWRSTWDREAYESIKNLYRESCNEAEGKSVPGFQELPEDLPRRFSTILEIVSNAIICDIERSGRLVDLIDHIKNLRQDLLKLYSDLILEEREYGIPLRPHRIERLLDLLKTYT
ncbi:MAG: hypothetical protein RQ885_00995 [Desulfurococcales archaeon]|nr:hypothetical protein [Desulfurococcales archaeon]